MSDVLLDVKDLRVQFHTDDGVVRAVDGVSFQVAPGQTLGIVGESGSGKSVTNLAIMGLVPAPAGRVVGGSALYRGQDLLKMRNDQLANIRGHKIAMIFQDPMTSLNPFLTIEDQLTEITRRHLGHNRRTARQHAIEMLDMVGIPGAARRIGDYPHQFSGGMRQRVMIAMALSCKPDLLIADEPTTALDVTIQAQILGLMKQLQQTVGMALVLISHDMGVVASVCDQVQVMYAGKIVESAPVDALYANPRHPYTRGLLNSVPRLNEHQGQQLVPIPGQPPDLAQLPPGCSYYPRCPYHIDRCRLVAPDLTPSASGGVAACFVDLDQSPSQEAPHA